MFSIGTARYLPWFPFALGTVACILLFFLVLSLPLVVPSLFAAIALAILAALGYRLYRNELIIISADIQRVQHRYQESEQRFRALLESLPKVAVQGYDKDRKVIYWNEASCWLYGYTRDEAIGRRLEDLLIPAPMREAVTEAHWAWITEGVEIPASELELKHKSGLPVPVFSHHVMLGEHTSEPLMFCVDVDLSHEKQAQRELDYVTRFDALTCLPNRQTFESELTQCLDESRRQETPLAVMFINIDRLSELNDAHGYAQADELLAMVAQRLRQHLASADLLSRFGGDEFAIALPRLQADSEAIDLIERVHAALAQPYMLDGHELHVTASVGVSLFPDNGSTVSELIRNANMAKNRAKQAGGNNYCFFNEQFHRDVVRRHELTERLREALRKDELSLYYQPQVAAKSGRIESFEALLRWFPREDIAVSPAELIEVAEHSDLIHEVGDWVMLAACRQQAWWKAQGLGDCRIDINLSGKQFVQDGVFERLEALIAEYDLTPRDIGVELTENVLIQASEQALAGLWRLYHLGMKIAIDDFGTGYSSLSYLKSFPITSIKIDRSFVCDAPTEPQDRAIMEATVFIGHRLGLEVVAEGVENEAQLELVREAGCDLVQGYYFFKPMSSDAVGKLFAAPALLSEQSIS